MITVDDNSVLGFDSPKSRESASRYRIEIMLTSNVKFIRKYLYSMGGRYSKFRGQGVMPFDSDSLVVDGKRIYQPMILRAAIILFSTLSIALIFKLASLFLFVLLISYYLLQFVLLKKERLTLTWSQINKYEVDDQRKIIAFSIEDNSKCSPFVFTAEYRNRKYVSREDSRSSTYPLQKSS